MSNTVKMVLYLVLIGLGEALRQWQVLQPTAPWLPVVIELVGVAGGFFHVDPPATRAKIDRLTAALGKAGPLAVLFCLAAGCSGQSPLPPVIASVELAICILNTYSADKVVGKSDGDAVADTIARCGTDAQGVARVLDASRGAQMRLGRVDVGS